MKNKILKAVRILERKIFDTLHFIRKKYRKILNLKTQGVRIMLLNQNKILLVKHRYGNLWVMPGGKIDKNKTPEQAMFNELKEEVGLHPIEFYQFGIYENNSGGKNDTVFLFIVKQFEKITKYKKRLIDLIEVKDMQWFDLDNLPENISIATKNRINECFSENEIKSSSW
jgi:8-oxo-dGTP pyrophosphatase MutT (NUDIX family)